MVIKNHAVYLTTWKPRPSLQEVNLDDAIYKEHHSVRSGANVYPLIGHDGLELLVLR